MPEPKTYEERRAQHEKIYGEGTTPPAERQGRGQVLNNLFPMPFQEGPPLPSILNIKWPKNE